MVDHFKNFSKYTNLFRTKVAEAEE